MSAAPFPPADATARLVMATVAPDRPPPWTVVVALPPVKPDPADLLWPGEMAALLTHDRGVTWPDAAGEVLAAATLRRRSVAALAFACLADALACKAQIGGGTA